MRLWPSAPHIPDRADGADGILLPRSPLVWLVYMLLQKRWLAVCQVSQEHHRATTTTRVADGTESLPGHEGMGRVRIPRSESPIAAGVQKILCYSRKVDLR